jgi:hypothetical protein
VRTAVGRLLTRWGWREGVAVKEDKHHDIRVQALKEGIYKERIASRKGHG